MLINSGRTLFSRLTLGMRFDRFLLDLRALLAWLDCIVAMITSSFDLVAIYFVQLPGPCATAWNGACGPL
jgi:hypothetical protein